MRNLKNLFLVLGSSLLFTAQAAVYQCTIDKDRGLLLALSNENNTGVILNIDHGKFSPINGKVSYTVVPDNGPTVVRLSTITEPTEEEWKTIDSCFVSGTDYI